MAGGVASRDSQRNCRILEPTPHSSTRLSQFPKTLAFPGPSDFARLWEIRGLQRLPPLAVPGRYESAASGRSGAIKTCRPSHFQGLQGLPASGGELGLDILMVGLQCLPCPCATLQSLDHGVLDDTSDGVHAIILNPEHWLKYASLYRGQRSSDGLNTCSSTLVSSGSDPRISTTL